MKYKIISQHSIKTKHNTPTTEIRIGVNITHTVSKEVTKHNLPHDNYILAKRKKTVTHVPSYIGAPALT